MPKNFVSKVFLPFGKQLLRYLSISTLKHRSCTNVLALKLSQTSTNEDRRVRKDIQVKHSDSTVARVKAHSGARTGNLWETVGSLRFNLWTGIRSGVVAKAKFGHQWKGFTTAKE